LKTTPGGKFELDLRNYAAYAQTIRRRLLRRCLKGISPLKTAPDKQVVERLDRLALKGDGTISLPGRVQATVTASRMLLYRRRKRTVREKFEPGTPLALDWPAVEISGRVTGRVPRAPMKKRRSSRVTLDWNKLTPPLEVRTMKPGDRFRPLGMKGHKKLGDYMTDKRVNRAVRDEILVLCDRQGPVWLIGYEIADRAKIDDKTKKVLSVEYHVGKKGGRASV
jgi:tRNA(Ile)-lysidine synthase